MLHGELVGYDQISGVSKERGEAKYKSEDNTGSFVGAVQELKHELAHWLVECRSEEGELVPEVGEFELPKVIFLAFAGLGKINLAGKMRQGECLY